MVDNILDLAKASLESAKKIKSVTENLFDDEEKEIIEQFKSSGQEKMKETLSTFSEYSSLFKEAGYELGSINANVSLPPEIRKRMQGKSCFNFKEVDKKILGELSELTKKGFEFYTMNGVL